MTPSVDLRERNALDCRFPEGRARRTILGFRGRRITAPRGAIARRVLRAAA